jgi:hypothetical protein
MMKAQDPHFFYRAFLHVIAEEESELVQILDLKQEAELSLSWEPSGAQDAFSFRCQRRSVLLAQWLIGEKGELHRDRVERLLGLLEKKAYIFYPQGFNDGLFSERLLFILKKLRNEPAFFKKIQKFSRPLCHQGAERLILDTIGGFKVTDGSIRQAVLAACLTLLRQNVGSCFATAPAILIHEEQIESFLDDLYDLLTTGKLKRTFGGVLFSAPLSPSWGALRRATDNPLLKSWEFTLASLSEVKMEFSRWNLYSSLGFDPEENGGLGQIIYNYLEEKLALTNDQVQRLQREYEIAFDQVKSVEVLLRRAETEAEARRLQAEYQSRAYHMRVSLEMREKAEGEAACYSQLFVFLIKQYDRQFPEYFQEIYDAEMQEIKTGPYDDSPAGFRLVYKHGRSDASLWTLIYDAKQYVDALVDFFRMSETHIAGVCDWEGAGDVIGAITTQILIHLRSPEFIETALLRMAKAHQASGRLEKKPWAYTSGGTMETLLKTYYRRESSLTEEARWVESPADLLTFILDTLKNLTLKNPEKRMLMYSPTHAFILQPGWDFLKEGWQDTGFTYTWVRDQVILPRQQFYAEMDLSYEDEQFLMRQFPFTDHSAINLKEFRESLPLSLRDQWDAFLYEALPLTPGHQWKDRLRYLLEGIVGLQVLDQFPDQLSEPMTARALQDFAKGCYLLSSRSSLSHFDVHQYIARRAQPFPPLLFADTNWAYYYFGFLVNPGTGQLELWRMDRTGSQGMPMSSWSKWLDGSTRTPWGIYTRPDEYC